MRTFYSGLTTVLIFFALLLTGCEGETGPAGMMGDQGPQGPQGPPGEDGEDGAANISTVTFSVDTDTLSAQSVNRLAFTRSVDSITAEVVSDGAVSAFIEVPNNPASVNFVDQRTDGTVVTVQSVRMNEGGFIAIHDSRLLADEPVIAGSVIGVSEKLEAGFHERVEVVLYDVPGGVDNGNFEEGAVLDADETLVAMPHFDTNDNGTYDFITSGGAEDGAYLLADGSGAVVDPAQITTDVTFTATLNPLNRAALDNEALLSSNFRGAATFTITDGQLTAETSVRGVAPNIGHAQHVHFADSCPTPSADANNDGFIDVVEGVPSYGPIFVPLTSDLTTQGAGTFPTADEEGGFTYSTTAPLADAVATLRADDPNPNDPVVKISADEGLSLEGRHVVIHSVPDSTTLPGSVSGIAGLSPQATLPIACGEISVEGGSFLTASEPVPAASTAKNHEASFYGLPHTLFVDADENGTRDEVIARYNYYEGTLGIEFVSEEADMTRAMLGEHTFKAVVIPPGASDASMSKALQNGYTFDTFRQAVRELGLDPAQTQ